MAEDTEPMKILQECLDLMRKKAHDYQNPNSSVQQADYYRHGVGTLMDIIEAKFLRLVSLIETYEADPSVQPKNESIEDSFKDMANYCAIAAAYCRGKVAGQKATKDILNRPVKTLSVANGTTIDVVWPAPPPANPQDEFIGAPGDIMLGFKGY